MPNKTIQKQGEVFISQSEYDALKAAGSLQNNTKYYITKDPDNLTKPDADTLYVPKSAFSSPWQVIMSSDPMSELTALDVRNIPTNHALAQYDTQGRLEASNPDGTYPTTDAERYVANVKYVDGKVGYLHHIHLANADNSAHNIDVYFTVKANTDQVPADIATLSDFLIASDGSPIDCSATGHIDNMMVMSVEQFTGVPNGIRVYLYDFTASQKVDEDIYNYGDITIYDTVK